VSAYSYSDAADAFAAASRRPSDPCPSVAPWGLPCAGERDHAGDHEGIDHDGYPCVWVRR